MHPVGCGTRAERALNLFRSPTGDATAVILLHLVGGHSHRLQSHGRGVRADSMRTHLQHLLSCSLTELGLTRTFAVETTGLEPVTPCLQSMIGLAS